MKRPTSAEVEEIRARAEKPPVRPAWLTYIRVATRTIIGSNVSDFPISFGPHHGNACVPDKTAEKAEARLARIVDWLWMWIEKDINSARTEMKALCDSHAELERERDEARKEAESWQKGSFDFAATANARIKELEGEVRYYRENRDSHQRLAINGALRVSELERENEGLRGHLKEEQADNVEDTKELDDAVDALARISIILFGPHATTKTVDQVIEQAGYLQDRHTRSKDEALGLFDKAVALTAQLAERDKAIAAARADAARLDWIQSTADYGCLNITFELDGGNILDYCLMGGDGEDIVLREQKDCRAAIDAAMATPTGPTPQEESAVLIRDAFDKMIDGAGK